jgi:hypothetical protein
VSRTQKRARHAQRATRKVLLAAVVVSATCGPAVARECALGQTVFEPVDQPRHFTMNVERDGHGFKFRLYSKPLKRTTNFVGSYQNGTGHLNLTEATVDEDSAAEGLLSRVVLFGSDLRTVDPWGKRLRPVAYAYFERLALELWDRARAKAEDNVVGSSPPDGLWRVVRCRTNPNKKAAVITSAGIFPVT